MGFLGKIFGKKEEEPNFNFSEMPEFPSPPERIISPRQQERNYPMQREELNQSEIKEVVYVRLDRFETSEKNFEDIKLKLQEIESNIKSVDRINQVEDDRLFSWGKNLEKIKNLLMKIDSKVFDQI